MRFSDLVSRLFENPRYLILAAGGALMLSVLIGLFAGLAMRQASLRSMRDGLEETAPPPVREQSGLLLPDPALDPQAENGKYHFYLEEHGLGLDLVPVRVSDLLRNRAVGVEVE
ncbi:MAG: hypothetical protein ACOC8N_06485 [Spirochaetota bacterium]